MQKIFRLKNLDCAHCASKMERAISKIDGVKSCSITFMTMRLALDIDESREVEILDLTQKAISKIEPDCKIVRV